MQVASTGVARGRSPGAYAGLPVARRISRASLAYVPLPVVLLLAGMLIPGEFDFNVGVMRLNCQRLVLLIWLPAAMMRLVSGRGVKPRGFDGLFIGAYAYYAFAAFVKEPFDKAIVSGGIIFVESVAGYLIARVYIRNSEQFLATVKLLFLAVLLVGALAIPECLLFNHLTRNFAAALTGSPMWPTGESRLGLMRAMVVFNHPIHYGVFCAGVFALTWFTEPDPIKRLFCAALVGGATFLSLSSAPLLGVGITLAGALWERTTRYIHHRVWLSIGLFSLLYFLASLLTNRSPLKILVTSVVFDDASAYYRILIWDFGLDNVLNNPWLGVHLHFWQRPAWMPNDSVDNYWLTIAMWGGLPSLVLYLLSIVAILRAVHNRRLVVHEQPEHRRCRYAWTAAVVALSLVGLTVHYWAAIGVFFTFILGAGGWLADAKSAHKLFSGARTQKS